MYLITIHVPIHIDGPVDSPGAAKYLDSDWLESLRLLRDSFGGRFGKIAVVAPSRSYNPAEASQTLERIDEQAEDLELIPSFDNRCNNRSYWLKHRPGWKSLLAETVSRADVVHSGLDDLYRPISYEGFLEGRRQGRATVFVQDTDIVVQCRQLNAHRDIFHRGLSLGYSRLFERYTRDGVATASLSLLKGQDLMDRYQDYQLNAKLFHDTSYSMRDVIEEDLIRQRCARSACDSVTTRESQNSEKSKDLPPIRFVYCGRLTPRKGILDSLEIVARCRQMGCPVELDIIGHGEQKDEIKSRIGDLHLEDSVRLLGRIAYGEELFAKLRSYDGLLFTPLAEDTPRMIFDGYAAGLPLIAYDIDYCIEREQTESATLLLPQGDFSQAASRIVKLASDPERMQTLSLAAHRAAVYHAAENWYRRRAEWTFEAVDRHQSKNKSVVSTVDPAESGLPTSEPVSGAVP